VQLTWRTICQTELRLSYRYHQISRDICKLIRDASVYACQQKQQQQHWVIAGQVSDRYYVQSRAPGELVVSLHCRRYLANTVALAGSDSIWHCRTVLLFVDDNDDENNIYFFLIFVDETKTRTKIYTKDNRGIKIDSILILTKISDTMFGTQP